VDPPKFNQEYLRRLIDGDEETVKHFMSHFSGVLGTKLRSQVRSAELVDDIKQETLYRVFRSIKQPNAIEQPERLGAYVNAVCNNVVLENFRSQGRYQGLPEEMPELTDASWRPEDTWITEERKVQVRQVLAEMPDKEQRLLRALFLEERDKDELCREFGVDRQYLRVLLHRAKNRFRVILIRNLQANA
jgi:RNA polymerase sigma-70 factor, ECF subfamily